MTQQEKRTELQQAFARALEPCQGKNAQQLLDYLNDLSNMLRHRHNCALLMVDENVLLLDKDTSQELLDFAEEFS